MGLITYENLEDGTPVTANVFNERFAQIIAQLNGNIDDNNISAASISKDKLKAEVYESIYPVGSMYVNFTVSTNPATLLGFGTWVAAAAGRFVAGYDSTQIEFNGLKQGGRKKLKNMFMPVGTTSLAINDRNGDGVLITDNSNGGEWFDSSNSGDGSTGSIIPPYTVGYVWKRIS